MFSRFRWPIVLAVAGVIAVGGGATAFAATSRWRPHHADSRSRCPVAASASRNDHADPCHRRPSASPPAPTATSTPSRPAPSGSTPGAPTASPTTGRPTTTTTAGPAPTGFPTADTTGWRHTGVTLHSCANTITKDGTTLDGCQFEDGLTIEAHNVTITRSRVHGIVQATYLTNWGLAGLELTDVEIDGTGTVGPNGEAAIGLDDYLCLRCDVHSTGRGANFRNNVTIRDSYFHDFVYVNGAHQSGVGSNGGAHNVLDHNNIECAADGCSGAQVAYGDFDPVDDLLITNNLFNTKGSYCVYAGSTGTSSGKPYPHGTNVRYLNNTFGRKYWSGCGIYGPVAAWENNSGNVWQGNHDDTGKAITP